MPKTNLDTSSNIRLICKLIKFLTETSSKMYKPKTYNKVIDNLIHKNRWHETIDKKLSNLNTDKA